MKLTIKLTVYQKSIEDNSNLSSEVYKLKEKLNNIEEDY